MKQRLCWYACDQEGCDEESPHMVDFEGARRAARDAGWQFTRRFIRVSMGQPLSEEVQFCQSHHRL